MYSAFLIGFDGFWIGFDVFLIDFYVFASPRVFFLKRFWVSFLAFLCDKQQLRAAIERLIRIFKSRLFQALLDEFSCGLRCILCFS